MWVHNSLPICIEVYQFSIVGYLTPPRGPNRLMLSRGQWQNHAILWDIDVFDLIGYVGCLLDPDILSLPSPRTDWLLTHPAIMSPSIHLLAVLRCFPSGPHFPRAQPFSHSYSCCYVPAIYWACHQFPGNILGVSSQYKMVAWHVHLVLVAYSKCDWGYDSK